MPAQGAFSFKKAERIYLKKQIDALFDGAAGKALSAFPLRMVYRSVAREAGEASAQVLISVPKRCLRHAVDRNRAKRQIREAYRLNKCVLLDVFSKKESAGVDIAFIWLDKQCHDSEEVQRRVLNLLKRLSERL